MSLMEEICFPLQLILWVEDCILTNIVPDFLDIGETVLILTGKYFLFIKCLICWTVWIFFWMWYCVVWQKFADVSEECTAHVFKVEE